MVEAAPYAVLIVNPVSAPVEKLRDLVRTAETEAGWRPTDWRYTTAADPGGDLVRQVLPAGPAVVIAAGGDGTVRAVAAAVRGSRVRFAVVPTGTGNLFARNLGLDARDLATNVRTAFLGADRSVDVGSASLRMADGRVQSHNFLVMAGIGLDAVMAEKTDPTLKRLVGWPAYAAPIAGSILKNESFRMELRIGDRRPRSARVHTMIIGNCGILTGDVVLLPDASLDDGLLDLIVLQPGKLSGWAPIGGRLAVNRIFRRVRLDRLVTKIIRDRDEISYRQFPSISVDFDEPQLVQLDGDVVGRVREATFSVEPLALIVRLPAEGSKRIRSLH